MDMRSYLQEMRFAVELVLEGLWRERAAHEALRDEVANLTKMVQANYGLADAIAQDALDADDVMLATGRHWDTYFGEDKKRHEKSQEESELSARLTAREFSLSALGGTALQYAKQGISVVHGDAASCPMGRSIGSVVLKDVIWQGRNQSSHWEDRNLHQPVVRCFEALKTEQNTVFGNYNQRSLAAEVVALLEWRDWAAFEADVGSLAGPST